MLPRQEVLLALKPSVPGPAAADVPRPSVRFIRRPSVEQVDGEGKMVRSLRFGDFDLAVC
jgi:hypothetical protein